LVSWYVISFKISNIPNDEKISDRFLVNEEVRTNTMCSFRRKIMQYWKAIRNISTKSLEDGYHRNKSVKVTCTETHKITVFESIQFYSFAKTPRGRLSSKSMVL
jgi:hypothetical protein